MRRTVCQIGNNGNICKHSESISVVQLVRLSFQWLLKFVSRTLEYCLGICIGALLGWLGGWCIGGFYVEYFEPVYFSDFLGSDEIMCWEKLPYIFAGAGIFAGAVIGAVVVFCFSNKTSGNKSDDKGSNHLDQ